MFLGIFPMSKKDSFAYALLYCYEFVFQLRYRPARFVDFYTFWLMVALFSKFIHKIYKFLFCFCFHVLISIFIATFLFVEVIFVPDLRTLNTLWSSFRRIALGNKSITSFTSIHKLRDIAMSPFWTVIKRNGRALAGQAAEINDFLFELIGILVPSWAQMYIHTSSRRRPPAPTSYRVCGLWTAMLFVSLFVSLLACMVVCFFVGYYSSMRAHSYHIEE